MDAFYASVEQRDKTIMKVIIPSELTALGQYLPRFVGLVGESLWFKRLDHLDAEQHKSPFRWKIISDYHWLEMAIGFQHDVLTKEGVLRPELIDEHRHSSEVSSNDGRSTRAAIARRAKEP
ncbi:hypothetical protein [Bradyrhizobium sp. CCGB01]|uniref:hypothetical protein n=1 Tax=Bradyrhizobium sp. CCGB01 TaxID=2949634 RepID=UPI0020B40435|nr:hypothetical protein [Bradyrhizobium sp. CCGB01]MCP3406155.1 hypothetical protein [Bradyrhizobium sp. CCGB01]